MLYILVLSSLNICAQGYSHYKFASKAAYIEYAGHGDYAFVSRKDWGAEPATVSTPLVLPVPYVIIHQSFIPESCHSWKECKRAMRWMQNDHQMTKGYADIGYNFAVGSDGAVYEGRGWRTVGAHAFGYNSDSIGIVFIGNWNTLLPPYSQIETAKKLIAEGVRGGYISREYMLIGHRQIRETECPGDALFDEISTWEKFEANV